MIHRLILLASIGLGLTQGEIQVNEAQSHGSICGASTPVMDTTHCANPILMNQFGDNIHFAACANSCYDFGILLSNPPWVSNTEEEVLCSNIWDLAARNITEDRQITAIERETHYIYNCTTEPGCCSNLGNWYPFTVDECGVRNGDNSSCADCAGTPNGDAVIDACSVCNGNGSSCADCEGTPNGNATLDKCDVCNGDGSSCSSSLSRLSTLQLIMMIYFACLLAILMMITCQPVNKSTINMQYQAQEELESRGIKLEELESRGIKLTF